MPRGGVSEQKSHGGLRSPLKSLKTTGSYAWIVGKNCRPALKNIEYGNELGSREHRSALCVNPFRNRDLYPLGRTSSDAPLV